MVTAQCALVVAGAWAGTGAGSGAGAASDCPGAEAAGVPDGAAADDTAPLESRRTESRSALFDLAHATLATQTMPAAQAARATADEIGIVGTPRR